MSVQQLNVLITMVSGAKENNQFLFKNNPISEFSPAVLINVCIAGNAPTMIEVQPVNRVNFVDAKIKRRSCVVFWVVLLPKEAATHVSDVVSALDAVGWESEQAAALFTEYGLDKLAMYDTSQMVQAEVVLSLQQAQHAAKMQKVMQGKALAGVDGKPLGGLVVP